MIERQLNICPSNGPYDENQVYDVLMTDIFDDEVFNSRGAISALSVHELAKEIKENGLIQPVTLQTFAHMPGKKFRLVAGYRRFKAHEVNSAETIRGIIKTGLSDLEARLFNLIENTQREDLNIKQEADAILHFKLAGWSEQKVADKVGKSRGWAQVRFMLLELPIVIQKEAAAGLFNNAQIRELYTLGNYDDQIELVKQIKDHKILGKKKEPKIKQKIDESKVRKQEAIFEMQEELQDAVGITHLASKAMGWCAGVVSDGDFWNALSDEAKAHGKFVVIPEHLRSKILFESMGVKPIKMDENGMKVTT